jgi:hypothetical protein
MNNLMLFCQRRSRRGWPLGSSFSAANPRRARRSATRRSGEGSRHRADGQHRRANDAKNRPGRDARSHRAVRRRRHQGGIRGDLSSRRDRRNPPGPSHRGQVPPLFEDPDIAASARDYPAKKIKARRVKLGEGIIGTVAQLDRPVLITDAEADPRIPRAASQFFPGTQHGAVPTSGARHLPGRHRDRQ